MLTEIRKDKIKLIKDPIKRMSYKGSGSAREVVRMIALALGLKIHEDEYGISAYGGCPSWCYPQPLREHRT